MESHSTEPKRLQSAAVEKYVKRPKIDQAALKSTEAMYPSLVTCYHKQRSNLTLSTQRNQRASRLLRLPAEIRNHIYSYAMGGHILVHRIHALRPNPVSSLFTLPRVCRQTQAETRLLLFKLNTFHIHSIDKLGYLLADLGPEETAAISSLRLSLDLMAHLDTLRHPEGDDLYARYITHIRRLTGLRRVVLLGVTERPREFVPTMESEERKLRGAGGVRKCAGRSDVVIEYE